ncbi:hypothetical protein, partial [Sphingopyxis terrae]|uniref:hypothetical protein n=1 Tax=Sphingopyxis terrae TaxID=33052 RepID=UPI003609E54C
ADQVQHLDRRIMGAQRGACRHETTAALASVIRMTTPPRPRRASGSHARPGPSQSACGMTRAPGASRATSARSWPYGRAILTDEIDIDQRGIGSERSTGRRRRRCRTIGRASPATRAGSTARADRTKGWAAAARRSAARLLCAQHGIGGNDLYRDAPRDRLADRIR